MLNYSGSSSCNTKDDERCVKRHKELFPVNEWLLPAGTLISQLAIRK